MTLEGEFCPACFATPDPRDSAGHQRRDESYIRGDAPFSMWNPCLAANDILYRSPTPQVNWWSRQRLRDEDVIQLQEILLNLKDHFWQLLDSASNQLPAAHRVSPSHRDLIITFQSLWEEAVVLPRARLHLNDTLWCKAIGGGPQSFTYAPCDRASVVGVSECSICMIDFDDEHAPARTECGHVFGGGCLDRWVEQSTLCPLCRQTLLLPPPIPESLDHTPEWLIVLPGRPEFIASRARPSPLVQRNLLDQYNREVNQIKPLTVAFNSAENRLEDSSTRLLTVLNEGGDFEARAPLQEEIQTRKAIASEARDAYRRAVRAALQTRRKLVAEDYAILESTHGESALAMLRERWGPTWSLRRDERD